MKVDVVEAAGIFENSEFFTCFLMLMIRMPETAKIRITIQVKDLYIADDMLYSVLD